MENYPDGLSSTDDPRNPLYEEKTAVCWRNKPVSELIVVDNEAVCSDCLTLDEKYKQIGK